MNLQIHKIKEIVFKEDLKRFPYLNYFWKNPYTYLKARYYMYVSIFALFYLLKTNVKPNFITIIYILSGFIALILISIPNYVCNILAIFIFFNKGILDWIDGHLARIKYKPTTTGKVLDEYGAHINAVCFTMGIGFYSMHQYEMNYFIYLIPFIPLFHGSKYIPFAKNIIFHDQEFTKKEEPNNNDQTKNKHKVKNKNYPKILYSL